MFPMPRYLLPWTVLLFLVHQTLWTTEAMAEEISRFVSDEFRITMRAGPAANYKVVRMLRTGMKLIVLEENSNGWNLVRDENGLEGWVLRRFLSGETPAKFLALELEKSLASMTTERDALQKRLDEANVATMDCDRFKKELTQIKSLSENALDAEKSFQELVEKYKNMEQDLKRNSEEKRQLERNSDALFFLSGAVVLFLGLLAGFILSRKRRNPYSSLS